jgi:hypothetical protein
VTVERSANQEDTEVEEDFGKYEVYEIGTYVMN